MVTREKLDLTTLDPTLVYSTHGGGFGDFLTLVSVLLSASELHKKPIKVAKKNLVYLQDLFETTGTLIEVEEQPNVIFFSYALRHDLEMLKERRYKHKIPDRIIPWHQIYTVPLLKAKQQYLGLKSRTIAYQFKARSRRSLKESTKEEIQAFCSLVESNGYRLVEVSGELSDQECLKVLSECEFYIGVDTGPTHLSLTVDTPTYVLQNKLPDELFDLTYGTRKIRTLSNLGEAHSLIGSLEEEPKVSFITTCKNRLEFAKKTFANLEFFLERGHEVVFVDYSCPEKSGEWVRQHYPQVTVVEIKGRQRYNHGEARSLGASAARNNLFCFLDIDIQVFPNFLFELSSLQERSFLFFANNPYTSRRGMGGFLVCSRQAYYKSGGYSSLYTEYGGKDLEVKYRLYQERETPAAINPHSVLHLDHSDELRGQFYSLKDIRKAVKRSSQQLKRRLKSFTKRNAPPPWTLNYDQAEYRQFYKKVEVDSLSLHVVDHCNFHCEGCDHASPLYNGSSVDIEKLLPSLKILSRYCYAKKIHLVGGEPFLHPDLYDFVYRLKKANKLTDHIHLYTNGVWLSERGLKKFAPVLDLVDGLHISLHPELQLSSEEVEGYVQRIRKRHGIRVAKYRDPKFYTVAFREKKKKRRECPVSKCLHLLPDGRLSRCAIIPYYAPMHPEQVTEGFQNNLASGYYDVMNGKYESFMKWMRRMPQCCHYCAYAETSKKHK